MGLARIQSRIPHRRRKPHKAVNGNLQRVGVVLGKKILRKGHRQLRKA